MSERISRSIHQTVLNMLEILAQQGDARAIAALESADEVAEYFEVVDDDSSGKLLMAQDSGTYLVTQHGATFFPRVAPSN
jgi:hypothetical protein